MAIIKEGFIDAVINNIKVNTSYTCNKGNYNNYASRDVKYVVIHYTGNVSDTALSNCRYFQSSGRGASAHFFVDENNIYQSVELRDVAWHVGCSQGYKNACRNANSLGIEMCTSGNYLVSDTTQVNAAYVCAYLCKKIGIGSNDVDSYVVRHYDVVKSNKSCPAQFVTNVAQWTRFKTWVKNILNTGNHIISVSNSYSHKDFVKEVQAAIGATVDGIAGNETLSKTVTVSKTKNNKHAVVKPIQKYLNSIGYDCGTADGVAGSKFDTAVKSFQKANGCTADGEITAKATTWKKLLKLE